MNESAEYERHLRRAITLACRGLDTVSPNPAVGAVIVKEGRVVGEGWHRRAGAPHAEALALGAAGADAAGATLFANLEPCCHRGRTPPCVDAIIEAGIERVVACIEDPNPLVGGKGFAKLRSAGIEVDVGRLASRAERLNEVYLHCVRRRAPFVHVKAGLSMDGRIATAAGESQWITSERALRYAQRLRRRYDAILVGVGTLLADDPLLTVRVKGGGAIHRIVIDSRLRTPPDAKVFSAAAAGDILIATTENADMGRLSELRSRGAEVVVCGTRDEKVDLAQLLDILFQRGITSVMVEGGGETIAAFLEAGLVNKVTFVYAPKIIGGHRAVPAVGGRELTRLGDAVSLRDLRSFRLGPDIAIEGYCVS